MSSEQKTNSETNKELHPSSISSPSVEATNDGSITPTQSPTPITFPELTPQQERKIKSLEASITKIQAQISHTEMLLLEAGEKYKSIRPAGTSPPDPASIVKRHIRLLHEYNEIKDVGQGLLGLIAEGRGVRYVDVQREFGVGGSD